MASEAGQPVTAPPTTTATESSKEQPTTSTTAPSSAKEPSTTENILLINGPNLNLLGTREPHIYGSTTLASLTASLEKRAAALGMAILSHQSNHEGAIIDRIHAARFDSVSAIIINPGAFTHTSVGIRDALTGVNIPFIEVHISNVHAREEFRHKSYLSDKAEAVICGLGAYGYVAALEYWKWKFEDGKMKGI